MFKQKSILILAKAPVSFKAIAKKKSLKSIILTHLII